MVERFGRIEEARGSIPLTSTPQIPGGAKPLLGKSRLSKLLLGTLLLATLLTACTGGTTSAQYEGLVVDEPRSLPQLVLTDTSGNPFDLVAQTQGEVAFLYFGFTHCPDVCNIQLNQVSKVLARPGAPKNVKLLFVSVDPERDTPTAIRSYLDNFSEDFIGLTAADAQLTQLQNEVGALAALRLNKPADEVVTPPHEHGEDATHSHASGASGDFQPGTANYEVGHDARMFAFAPDGVGYTQYPHPTRQSQYAHDLPLLAEIAPS